MSGERVERRLAAILAADVAGYSRLMGEDEAGTLARLRTHRRDLIDPKIAEHKGRVVKTTGDGILIEFPSVVEAVACAVEVQRAMVERNAATPDEQRIVFRVGINLGDVIVEGDDIHGDGVNVAARLEGIAEPGGICVSAVVHDQVQGRHDCAFEDIGEPDLKNIRRKIRVYRAKLDAPATTLPAPALPLPEKPSIAVLPFQNMSGDPEQEYFADGMVEEIITALSRIRWLFVIARNSSFTYKGQAIDVKRVGRELGVRYVLEGSVRKGGGRVRITGQLIEAESGAHLWADRFDGSLEDVFDLQDQVATAVAGVIEPALQAAEMARSARRSTSEMAAYDFYLQALANFYPIARERTRAAAALLDQAIAIDPDFGLALSWAAMCRLRAIMDGWAEAPETERRSGVQLARRALEVGQDDAGILVNAAVVLAYFGEDSGAMSELIDRALTLNPSFALGWFRSGMHRVYTGELNLAIAHFETSMRLSPRRRIGTPLTGVGMAHFFKRRFDEAVPKLLAGVQDNPGWPRSYYYLAASYAHLGQKEEARAIVQNLRSMGAPMIPNDLPYREQDRKLLLSGLRLAMGEEAGA